MDFVRSSGVIMHISSLPGKYGIGDLGESAYRFADFLSDAAQKLWQILPTGPTGYGNSPYQSFSAFAGNPYFIDLEYFVEKGVLEKDKLDILREGNTPGWTDYDMLHKVKMPLLREAYENYSKGTPWEEMRGFQKETEYWIEDYCLFMALKGKFDNKEWQKWPKKYRYRDKKIIKQAKEELKDEMEYYLFLQYIFHVQWKGLKEYTNRKNIKIIGDIPIFIASDSADVWAREKLFLLDKHKKPKKISGVPPDAFSRQGQLWGNPLYDWDYMEKTRYKWWKERVKSSLKFHDIIRIDHFRGFESCWSVRYGAKNAAKGKWMKGPGIKFFREIKKSLGDILIIAEDLGFLTPQVRKMLKESGYPGMKILEFAFDFDENNEYLPHRYEENSVAYTGTHDNDTVLGWYNEVAPVYREICEKYLGNISGVQSWEINWKYIEAIWSSPAVFAITQMQDLVGLGSEARMNTPSTSKDNWHWRLEREELQNEVALRLRKVTEKNYR